MWWWFSEINTIYLIWNQYLCYIYFPKSCALEVLVWEFWLFLVPTCIWYKINKINYNLDLIIPFQTDIGRYCGQYWYSDISIFFFGAFQNQYCYFLQNRYDILVYWKALVCAQQEMIAIHGLHDWTHHCRYWLIAGTTSSLTILCTHPHYERMSVTSQPKPFGCGLLLNRKTHDLIAKKLIFQQIAKFDLNEGDVTCWNSYVTIYHPWLAKATLILIVYSLLQVLMYLCILFLCVDSTLLSCPLYSRL